MTDEQLESLITDYSKRIEAAMAIWDAEGCFAARGEADGIRAARDELIRGRSPEQVRRMELERGL